MARSVLVQRSSVSRSYRIGTVWRADVGKAGLGAGATEAVLVVSPMEVVKIRLQAQQRESTSTHAM